VEVFNVLAVESREEVDRLMSKALGAGGTEPRPPQEEGWYARAFRDIDGHDWEVFSLDRAT
jgi:predicted lactoylglutathione lyase